VKLAVETLLEVVESSKNIEICVMSGPKSFKMLADSEIAEIVKVIEKEREAEAAAKQGGAAK
jgi:20S proteasome alpha/beta subunit